VKRDTRLADLGVATGFLILGVLLLVAIPEAHVTWPTSFTGHHRWWEFGPLAVAFLGSTQRRTRPIPALAVGALVVALGPLVVGVTGVGVMLIFCDLLYCAVRYSSARASLLVATCAATVLMLATILSLLLSTPVVTIRVVYNVALVLGIPMLWAYEVRQYQNRAELERQRAAQSERVAELARAAAVAAERARMARDLHDVIASQLSAIAIQSEAALTTMLATRADERLREILQSVRRTSIASLAEMRTMIDLLRSDAAASADPRTAPHRLDDNIVSLLDAGNANGLKIVLLDQRPPGDDLPASVDLAAYRIVQESLTNAAKHAPGSTVYLTLARDGGLLRVEVENELPDHAVIGEGGGVGLLGLRERAAAIGGRVRAGIRNGRWSVHATLPIETKGKA